MSADALTHLILAYGYWILIPLCFIEGPIVAFVAGALASLGYFNPYLLFVIFFVRDVAVDSGCYFLGKYAGGTAIAKKLFSKIAVTPKNLENIRRLWLHHPGKTMFFSKLSYGVAAAFIVVAGVVGMPFKKFFLYGSLIAVMHYGTLLVLGYFFGNSFGSISTILQNVQLVILGVAVFAVLYYFFKKFISSRLLEAEKEEEISSTDGRAR